MSTSFEEFMRKRKASWTPQQQAFYRVVRTAFKREYEALEATGGRLRFAVSTYLDGKWFMVQVPSLDLLTQADSAAQIESQARDCIATWLDVEPDSFDVDIDYSGIE